MTPDRNGYKPKGRVTHVPDMLLEPHARSSFALRTLSAALNDICRSASASDIDSLSKMDLSDAGLPAIIAQQHRMILDELSIYSHNSDGPDADFLIRRSKLEYRAAVNIEALGSIQNINNEEDFIDFLILIHRSIDSGISKFRNGRMVIRPDDDGNLVIFPDYTLCRPLIHSLFHFIRSNTEEFPALCAVVAYAGVIHAHPFRDGNGRTSRVLFNMLMRRGCGSSHFLPLSCMTFLSKGGFLIKLRRALYGGEWEPLLRFFCDAMRLSNYLQRVGQPR